ncbi:AI-2E family transporter [Tsukamurella tyrosinosolvens]|uniref:AI-2E family transporter n=1 Tax=Tsukamurella tyrosinosolvens TaxID=57704 RepID=UPI000DF7101F|nr:AI-2E family transporter [Tsukamurella tyrosinosolvens]MEC4615894.1 AI-2E family transporter [Tsukamurella tyrosinosolvens]RDB46225.1 AI-2E family transporter [Tsukamurella tyrosinosolvens]
MSEETTNPPPGKKTRSEVYGEAGRWLATWSWRTVAVAALLFVLSWVIGEFWSILLPVLLAILLCTVLWPPVRWLRSKGLPPALATALVLLFSLGLLGGIIGAIAPSIGGQSKEIADRAVEGVGKVQKWAQGPPLNLQDEQISKFVTSITKKLQESAETIATGVFTGVSAAGSFVVAIVMVAMLTFFFLKDGDKFMPWLKRHSGTPVSEHFAELLSRIWATLGGFIRTQAVVSFIDALFIGLGLVILQVPLAGALAVITFLGGFIPIVGAFVAGALAVIVALVTNGFGTALAVLAVVIAVQQLEGNVLSPILQSRSMQLHPAIVLLAIAFGGTQFGIIGAFLAVPVAAAIAVLFRYLGELVDEQTGETPPPEEEPKPSFWDKFRRKPAAPAAQSEAAADAGPAKDAPAGTA